MKENEFLDGVSNIESDVVERFISMDNNLRKRANKPNPKRVWLRLGTIAACFLLILSAVVFSPMLNKVIWENETEPNDSENIELPNGSTGGDDTEIKIENNTDKETTQIETNSEKDTSQIEQEYLMTDSGKYIYCSAGESASGINDGYRYKDVKELEIVSSTPDYSYVDETKEKTIKYNFNKKEVELEYYKSYKSQICLTETSGLVAKYNNYDIYKDVSGTLYSFFAEDNKLRHYYTKNEIQQGNTTKISKEQAIQISNNFLIDLLGEEVFKTYTMDENKNVSIMFNEYWISYTKYFHGFRTTDTITMRINMEGSISAYVGRYVSLYDEAMKTITYNDIIDAEAELMVALYLPNMRVVDETIEMNDKGEVCLAMYTVHGKDEQYADVFYLPITHQE